jgi:protein-L-isoaspartate(D-aspartate) O-methyltransferase
VKLLMKKMISKKRNLLKHLKNKGFSEKLLHAFESVEREKFVPEEYQDLSYEDVALPIGYDQTISQPYTIAFMLRLLNVVDGEKVLEVGSGSGYVLSLLSELNPKGKIFGIESNRGACKVFDFKIKRISECRSNSFRWISGF